MFVAPYPPYDPSDKDGFSWETVVHRWPKILTGVVDQLSQENHKLFLRNRDTNPSKEESDLIHTKIEEGQKIIETVSRLKYEMGRNYELWLIPDDGEYEVSTFNKELKALKEASKNTWMTAPWLFAECYLYRLLRAQFSLTQHWKNYDPFRTQKLDTFRKSSVSIRKLATTMYELEEEKDKLDEARLAVLWKEMLTMALWGNATDLSLLTHLTISDIENLQAVGKDAQASRSKFILRDDQDLAWNRLKQLKGARIDFILDNAGFEVFTDLLFADFLVTYTPFVSKVVFHGKLIPWFVSDVTPPDWRETFEVLLDSGFFPNDSNTENVDHLLYMAKRWKGYVTDGTFQLSVPVDTPLGGLGDSELVKTSSFWTTPFPYWNMKVIAPTLWNHLAESGLVIFKGDLNYRKLTGDVDWPHDTPFEVALGPLAGSFPLLSLRTNKADVVVGVEKDVADRLTETEGRKWRTDGRYALISFVDGV
ncbi:DUF89 domain-containing protein [Flagelloscypha sp. PMI_526]|nr:DUF89 domain-containing protein [Flagelloscypha sp. PMI_526]